MTRGRAELALVFNTVIWGATFVTVKQALSDASPLLFLALRFSLATVALLAVFRGRLGDLKGPLRGGLIVGTLLFAGYAFQTFGLRLTTAPKSAFLTGLTSVMVPFLGALVYRNRPGLAEIAGVGVATAGMGLMTLERFALSMGAGDLLTLCCAVAFAGHIVALGHYSQQLGFEWLSVMQVGTAAALSLGTFWWTETPRIRWSAGLLAAVVLTGILATALAFSIQAWAQRYTTSTRTALIFTLEPVFAWLTSWLLAGETLPARGVAGAGLILAGVLLVELKPLRAQTHP